jgi:hypothetical protein
MKISKDKKYNTRLGLDVIIYKIWEEQNAIHGAAVDRKGFQICALEWDLEGKVWGTTESGNDLIEVSPYADFKIDDKVLVWENSSICPVKRRGHFAGVSEDGKPTIWDMGRTSFTETNKVTWDNCEHD